MRKDTLLASSRVLLIQFRDGQNHMSYVQLNMMLSSALEVKQGLGCSLPKNVTISLAF